IYKVCEYESDKTYAYWDPENPEDKQRRWLEPSVLHYLRCHELQPPVMYTSLLYDLAYRTKPFTMLMEENVQYEGIYVTENVYDAYYMFFPLPVKNTAKWQGQEAF